jgi:hypothetical protein
VCVYVCVCMCVCVCVCVCVRALLQIVIFLIYPNYYTLIGMHYRMHRLTEVVAKSDDLEDELLGGKQLALHLFQLRFLRHPRFLVRGQLLQIVRLVMCVL